MPRSSILGPGSLEHGTEVVTASLHQACQLRLMQATASSFAGSILLYYLWL